MHLSCIIMARQISYSGLFSRRLYFANFARAQLILENKIIINVEEARFSISIREIHFSRTRIELAVREI